MTRRAKSFRSAGSGLDRARTHEKQEAQLWRIAAKVGPSWLVRLARHEQVVYFMDYIRLRTYCNHLLLRVELLQHQDRPSHPLHSPSAGEPLSLLAIVFSTVASLQSGDTLMTIKGGKSGVRGEIRCQGGNPVSGGKSGVRGEIRCQGGNPVSGGKSGVRGEIRCQGGNPVSGGKSGVRGEIRCQGGNPVSGGKSGVSSEWHVVHAVEDVPQGAFAGQLF